MLKAKIQEDLKLKLKERDELAVSVLRLLLAAIFNREKEKRYKLSKGKSKAELEKMGKESEEAKKLEKESALTDKEVIEAILSEIKKKKESILLFEKGKRENLANKEKKEMEILQKYLPQQLSEEKIKKLAKEVIKKIKIKETKDIGKVMAELMLQVKGRADGSLVSRIVKELLNPVGSPKATPSELGQKDEKI